MWAIPLWAYAVVVVVSLLMIVGLLGLVYALAKPSSEDKRRGQAGGAAPPLTAKEKRVRGRPRRITPINNLFFFCCSTIRIQCFFFQI